MQTPELNEQPGPTQLSRDGTSILISWAIECDDCYTSRVDERPTVRGVLPWPAEQPAVREYVSN